MTETPACTAARMVNLERYPVDEPDSNSYAELVRTCRDRFVVDGLCMLPEFIRPKALDILAKEANERTVHAWFCGSTPQRLSREERGLAKRCGRAGRRR